MVPFRQRKSAQAIGPSGVFATGIWWTWIEARRGDDIDGKLHAGCFFSARAGAGWQHAKAAGANESEVRALQRKVFPGGDGTFFPQITAPAAAPTPAPMPSTSPLTDMLVRMDGVERQVAQLTAQVEQNTNKLNQLEARLNAMPVPQPGAMAAQIPGSRTMISPAPAARLLRPQQRQVRARH